MSRRLTEYERPLDVFAELRRQMDQVWEDFEPNAEAFPHTALRVRDAGDSIVIEADLPGIAEKDVELTLADNVLFVTAERKLAVPEGYAPRRQERASFRFSRSHPLPVKVDPEKVVATVKDGVLTVTLAKAEEARPRQIRVKVAS
jgi:HSP20 family protein